jgi:hypothetical protein
MELGKTPMSTSAGISGGYSLEEPPQRLLCLAAVGIRDGLRLLHGPLEGAGGVRVAPGPGGGADIASQRDAGRDYPKRPVSRLPSQSLTLPKSQVPNPESRVPSQVPSPKSHGPVSDAARPS